MPYFMDAHDQARFGISEPDEDDDQAELEPDDDTCPRCDELAVAEWDHHPDCEHYREMQELPF